MRRGLIAWDADELPLSVLQGRVAKLQNALRAEKLAALLAYTTIARPAAVTYLTGFTPYWSEGLLYVPADGDPFFATALSKRVGEWIGTTLQGARVVNTPRPSALIAEKLAAITSPRLGVLDLDDLPGGHTGVLIDAVPGLLLVDATALFDAQRATPDASETALIRKAAALAESALASISVASAPRTIASDIERALRLGGAEECYVTIAPDLSVDAAFRRVETLGDELGATFAVRVSSCRKGLWARRTRTVATPAHPAFQAAEAAFAALVDDFDPRRPAASQIEAALRPHGLRRWMLEAPRGGAPLAVVAASDGMPEGTVPASGSVLSVEGHPGGSAWAAARTLVAG